MTARSLTVLIVLAVSIGSVGQLMAGPYSDTVLGDNPYGYWRFDETDVTAPAVNLGSGGAAIDGSYNQYAPPFGSDGVPTLGAAGIPGAVGNTAAQFNGTSPVSQVYIPDTVSPAAYTIEAWIKADAGATTGRNIIVRTAVDPRTTYSHSLRINNDGLLENFTEAGGVRYVWDSAPVQPDQWYHVVGLAREEHMELYVNGELKTLASWGGGGDPWTGGNQWRVGAVSGDGTYRQNPSNILDWFDGVIDEVAIYHTELSSERIRQHHLVGMGTSEKSFAGPSDLDLEGNFLYAVNVGTAGLPLKAGGPYNVGDVVFAHDGANSGVTNTQASVINNWANPNFGATTDDDNMEFVMQSIRHGGSQPAQINLDGLTPGREYQLQMMFTESCCDRGFDVSVEGVLIDNNFAPHLTQGGINNVPTNGAVITYTFTAGDDVANIVFNSATAPFPDKNPILSAITLEDISPEFAGNVALGKPIIDGSSAYNGLAHDNNTAGFATSHVTDGSDTDVSGQSYWLGTQGQVNEFFVLDLQKEFLIERIDLRNTHNAGYDDRGTADFLIRGSNDLALITGPTSAAPIILSGTLSDVAGLNPIPADSFTWADGLALGHYRYLRFETLTSTYGNNLVGLNEIEVFAGVPEPGTLALLAIGLAGLAIAGWRRRRAK